MKLIKFLLFTLLFISCNQEKGTVEPIENKAILKNNELVLSDEQLKSIEIAIGTLEKKQVAETLNLNGKVVLNPDYKVSLSSALGGHITAINALPGKPVKKGEIILTLEDQQFIQIQQDYLTTKAQLLSAAPNYERQKELNASKSASDRVMQQAETEYRSLVAIKKALEEKLKLININPSELTPEKIKRSISIAAPFNGFISEVFVNKGKYVSSSDVLVELINPQGLLLDITVFEKDLAKIQTAQIIEVYTNEIPDAKIQAKVVIKGTNINENGSSGIIAQFTENFVSKLVPGQYINAQIALENIDAYTVSSDAVVYYEGKSYVFELLGKNLFKLNEIKTGAISSNGIEIKNGKDLQDKKIVAKGAYALLMALKNKAEE